ncbi:Os03g0133650, partial [Oryza sativa Japonica Group]
ASHGPGLLPEQELLRLPRRRLGQVAEHHRPRRHVTRQPRTAERDDLVRRRACPVLQRDERARRLAPVVVRPRHHRRVEHRVVAEQHRLHLDRADVLAARYDDVLGAILELDIPVRVAHAEVARAQPPAAHGLLRGRRVLVVPAHDRVAAEHDLADGAPVGRHARHGHRVLDVDVLQHLVLHPLERLDPRALGERQRVPLGSPHAPRRRPVRLGEAVPVLDVETELLHLGQHLRRRRRAARRDEHPPRQRPPLRRRRVHDHVEHRGRAAHVGHAVAHDLLEDDLGHDVPDADVRPALRRRGPRHAPPVAVEHGHGPEVHRHGRHVVAEQRGQRVQVRAAVAVDDALRPRRRPRRVVERYRVALVGRPPDLEAPRRVPQKRLVL